MIFIKGDGLIRLSIEKQFCLETTSRLFTLQFSDYRTLDSLDLDENGDLRLDPLNSLFPYSAHAYPEQFQKYLVDFDPTRTEDYLVPNFTPEPRAYRWIRKFDSAPSDLLPQKEPKIMVGYCLPEEVNKTRWLHCLIGDEFHAYPLNNYPEDFDDIWIYEEFPDDIEPGETY